MSPFDLVVRFAGYSAAELDGQPWGVRARRLTLGLLVIGSASFAAAMLTLAVSRIDASNPARWFYAPLGALVYFVMLAGFDSLFVASTEPVRRGSAATRIILSIVMTAFSAITVDALIAGDRLLAEIDRRRAQANLDVQVQHRAVHGVDAKANQLAQATASALQVEKDLAGDPPTPEFHDALAKAAGANGAYTEAQRSVEPKLVEVRTSMAELRAQLAALPETESDERQSAFARLAGLRVQRDAVEGKLRLVRQAAESTASAVADLRQEWRLERSAALQVARGDQSAAHSSLQAANRAAEQDADSSRATNARAFKANLVEEMTAYWGLAGRDHGYLVIGLVVWAGAMALELLAILTKMKLAPDELDRERQQRAALAAMRSDVEREVWAYSGAALHAQSERARLESAALIEAMRSSQSAAETASTMVVDAFVALQHRKLAADDATVQASLDAHFEALQRSIDAQLAVGLGVTGTAASTAADAGAAPTPPVSPPTAPARPSASGLTVVL